jgi:hypothetical protein
MEAAVMRAAADVSGRHDDDGSDEPNREGSNDPDSEGFSAGVTALVIDVVRIVQVRARRIYG